MEVITNLCQTFDPTTTALAAHESHLQQVQKALKKSNSAKSAVLTAVQALPAHFVAARAACLSSVTSKPEDGSWPTAPSAHAAAFCVLAEDVLRSVPTAVTAACESAAQSLGNMSRTVAELRIREYLNELSQQNMTAGASLTQLLLLLSQADAALRQGNLGKVTPVTPCLLRVSLKLLRVQHVRALALAPKLAVMSGCTAEDVLLTLFYSGLVLAAHGNKYLGEAEHRFDQCAQLPARYSNSRRRNMVYDSSIMSKIQLDAFRHRVFCSLMLRGDAGIENTGGLENLKSSAGVCNKWAHELAEVFTTKSAEALAQFFSDYRTVWRKTPTLKAWLPRLQRAQFALRIVRTTNAFAALSFTALAKQVNWTLGLPALRKLVLQMVMDGQLTASIDETQDVVRFSETVVTQQLSARLQQKVATAQVLAQQFVLANESACRQVRETQAVLHAARVGGQ
ncbi:MAG: hypothetical protein MHM6MM_005439 [Cercozoa sp. M6MM]